MSFVSAKAACRRRLRATLQRMSPEARDQQSRDICSHLATLPEIVTTRCLMLYAALPLEPDLDSLITHWTEAGKWVVLPRIEGTAPGHIEPVRVRGPEDLVAGYQGIREPGRAANESRWRGSNWCSSPDSDLLRRREPGSGKEEATTTPFSQPVKEPVKGSRSGPSVWRSTSSASPGRTSPGTP
ncbi:MAG: 5-formyltetrahydrofolate cyclo-ligase [Verrucomicrobiales bacterium]